ncbi:MAG: hypoxanthine phosphoribosyltransferase, partial [Eubacteriaceae bacterium]|nr:hypoxanthine phosphoribosyltransferase [Eubacteriaceae bacterium]
QIDKDYKNRVPVLLCILNGSAVFAVDLMRKMKTDTEICFMQASSYGDNVVSKGTVTILKNININLEGRDVIIVDDIADTCTTLTYLLEHLKEYNPNSIKSCVLLNKLGVRKPQEEIKIDYKGADIPNEFVVGYGLDYANKYRDLPYIGILKKSIYERK